MNLEDYARVVGARPRLAFSARDAGEAAAWQRRLRARLRRMTGLDRIAAQAGGAGPPAAVRRGVAEEADHVREEWVVRTEPGHEVPLFLLRPLDAGPAPRPLVLAPHGHGASGRFGYVGLVDTPEDRALIDGGERDIALQAVRAGFIAVAPEARAFGESRGPAAIASGAPWVCDQWQDRALLHGRTLIGERVWDIMRLIDWAATLDGVDATRVAITGNSGGGTVALFAAALDERIGVCVPGSYFCTFTDSIAAIRHCGCNYVPGLLDAAEMSDVAGLIAPRPFLAVHGERDEIFPVTATRRAWGELRHIYTTIGADAADRCRLHVGDGGHRYYKAPVWPFVERWV